MSNLATENKMGVMPVKKLLITMALPMMASMLVQAMYNIVDSIFVSRISEEALTAVSMASPVQTMMIGVATGTAVGVNALLARKLGEKKPGEANLCALNGMLLAALSFVVFFIVGLLFSYTFIEVQTDDALIVSYGGTYLSICLVGSLGFFMYMMVERILQGTGRTGLTMYTQGLGSIVNIILDPLLIFGLGPFPEMGIAGAALATVIGQWASFFLAIVLNLKYNHDVKLTFKGFRPDFALIKEIYIIGIPVIIMNCIGSVLSFCMNIILTSFTATATAVYGVYFKLQTFVFLPVMGINNALLPIASYNLGAKKGDRIVEALRFSLICAAILMIAGLIIVQLFPAQFLGLFNASETMLEIGVPALRIISSHFIFAGFIVVIAPFFQALGYSYISMIVSFARQMVVLLPAAYLLSLTGNLNMVWLAFPIAEITTFIVCVVYIRYIYKKVILPICTPK